MASARTEEKRKTDAEIIEDIKHPKGAVQYVTYRYTSQDQRGGVAIFNEPASLVDALTDDCRKNQPENIREYLERNYSLPSFVAPYGLPGQPGSFLDHEALAGIVAGRLERERQPLRRILDEVDGEDEDDLFGATKLAFMKRQERKAARLLAHPFLERARIALVELRWLLDAHSPRRRYYDLKAFYQRGRRGYSDSDLWDGDRYLLRVMVGMLEQFREVRQHLVTKALIDVGPDEWREYLLSGDPAYAPPSFDEHEWWDVIVPWIITSLNRWDAFHFDGGLHLLDSGSYQEERKWVDEEFQAALAVFCRYFGSWWL